MARIGIVLGAGGPLGQAYHLGVLTALTELSGWDARDCEALVGTSAGSLIGAYLRRGLSAADLASAYLGAFTFERLAAAGRVEELADGAIARASALFRTALPPYCPEPF